MDISLIQKTLAEESLSKENLEEFRYFVSLMSKELERCGNIVSGLLSFSRETHLEYKSLNFNDILEAVLTLTRHKMELQNIHLITDLAPGMIMIRGDANQLQQALLNLIFNAIESMIEGGELKIYGSVHSNSQLEINVSDTGCGISAEDMEKLFTPFFTTKERGQGTGLGLAVSYGIIERHGGRIEVQSKTGEGSTFTVLLPQ